MLPLYQTARLYVVLADIILLLMLLQLCCFNYLLVRFTPCSTWPATPLLCNLRKCTR